MIFVLRSARSYVNSDQFCDDNWNQMLETVA